MMTINKEREWVILTGRRGHQMYNLELYRAVVDSSMGCADIPDEDRFKLSKMLKSATTKEDILFIDNLIDTYPLDKNSKHFKSSDYYDGPINL